MTDIETAEEISKRWNPSPTTDSIDLMVGGNVPLGDGRATYSGDPALDESSSIDAGLRAGVKSLTPVEDDEDDDEDVAYSDMTKAELQAEVDSRNEDRDEDDHLSRSGSKAELIERLEADDQ